MPLSPDFDLSKITDDFLLSAIRPTIFNRRMGYSERICLERWVSGCEPTVVYDRRGKVCGLALANGDGSLVVRAPPTDKFYTASSTGYPPDWDFYKGCRTGIAGVVPAEEPKP